jgi:hypothetical protein
VGDRYITQLSRNLWNPKKPTFSGYRTCRSFSELRSDLQQQVQWRTALEQLPASTRIGFLHIDAEPLKEALMPVTQQAIEQVLSWTSYLMWRQNKGVDIIRPIVLPGA